MLCLLGQLTYTQSSNFIRARALLPIPSLPLSFTLFFFLCHLLHSVKCRTAATLPQMSAMLVAKQCYPLRLLIWTAQRHEWLIWHLTDFHGCLLVSVSQWERDSDAVLSTAGCTRVSCSKGCMRHELVNPDDNSLISPPPHLHVGMSSAALCEQTAV